MGYQPALEKAWSRVLDTLRNGDAATVKFLSDTYTADLKSKTVVSNSCNIPAKDHISIIVLHYLAAKSNIKPFPRPTQNWVDFNEIPGGEGYYPAFRKRTIDRVIKKYGASPEALKDVLSRMPSKMADKSDVSVVIYPFEEIPILITLAKADEEFGADANILFDKSISDIFCTEDIVVLTEIVVHQL